MYLIQMEMPIQIILAVLRFHDVVEIQNVPLRQRLQFLDIIAGIAAVLRADFAIEQKAEGFQDGIAELGRTANEGIQGLHAVRGQIILRDPAGESRMIRILGLEIRAQCTGGGDVYRGLDRQFAGSDAFQVFQNGLGLPVVGNGE